MAEEIDAAGRVGAVGSADFSTTQDSTTGAASRPAAGRNPSASGRGAAEAADRTPSALAGRGRQPARQPSPREIDAAVKQVNAHLASVNRVLELRVDPATGLTIATIRNAQTGAVLQQMPGVNIMHLAQMLADWSPGKNVLVDLIA